MPKLQMMQILRGIIMSIERVREYLKKWGREKDVIEFTVSSATVALAAEAAGVIPARIAKTLTFEGKDGCILIVTAGDARIDNGKFKKRFRTKARMLDPNKVLDYTGYEIGGVCPFAIEHPEVTVYCDISMRRFSTVFPACGSSNSAIELSCNDIFKLSGASEWVDVCRDWETVQGQ